MKIYVDGPAIIALQLSILRKHLTLTLDPVTGMNANTLVLSAQSALTRNMI